VNPVLSALAVAALATIAASGVVAGYRRRDVAPVRPMGDPLEDRRLALERSLEDLDEAHAGGALEAGEFVRLRAETQARLDRVDGALERRSSASAAAVAPEAPRPAMRVPSWAVGLLLAGVVGAIVLSSITREGVTTAASSGPVADASDPFAFFEQRVRQHPEDIAARLDLARRYLDAGRVKDALEQYGAALKLDPQDAEARAQIGLILFLNDRPRQALASVDAALDAAPEYPEALFYRGVILLRGVDRPEQAIDAFERYLDAAPFGAERDAAQRLIRQAQARAAG
jgi:tetratricopeptide (TPR) repeat protein